MASGGLLIYTRSAKGERMPIFLFLGLVDCYSNIRYSIWFVVRNPTIAPPSGPCDSIGGLLLRASYRLKNVKDH